MSKNTMLILVAVGGFLLWQKSRQQQTTPLINIPSNFTNWDPFA